MEYQATAKYIRTSTRKLRLMADMLRGMNVVDALAQLSYSPKMASEPMKKAISSAVANAKQKSAKEETLTIKAIEVMGGPAMKRWHAVSRGQAHPFKKRMTHVRITLADSEEKKE